jgi:hypothetical protein
MSEIDLAKQQGEKITRMKIHDGRTMSICTACLKMAKRSTEVLHAAGCPHIDKLTQKEQKALLKQMKDSYKSRWTKEIVKAPSLIELARFISEVMKLKVELAESWSDTDRSIGRLRSPGKGRHGKRLKVFKNDQLIFDHDSSETYRHNTDVCHWILEHSNAK